MLTAVDKDKPTMTIENDNVDALAKRIAERIWHVYGRMRHSAEGAQEIFAKHSELVALIAAELRAQPVAQQPEPRHRKCFCDNCDYCNQQRKLAGGGFQDVEIVAQQPEPTALTFDEWIHREDYGDVEQLRRAFEAGQRAVAQQPSTVDALNDQFVDKWLEEHKDDPVDAAQVERVRQLFLAKITTPDLTTIEARVSGFLSKTWGATFERLAAIHIAFDAAALLAEVKRLTAYADVLSGQLNRGAAAMEAELATLRAAQVPVVGTWQPIETATDQSAPPWNGEPVLIYTNGRGNPIHRAMWTDAIHGNACFGWAIEDCKHGPYALRGYTLVTHWMPLPAAPGEYPTEQAVVPVVGTWAWALEMMKAGQVVTRQGGGQMSFRGDGLLSHKLHRSYLDATDWQLAPVEKR